MTSIAVIVAARGGSVRLPRKNMLDFGGKPLIAHKVCQLLPLVEAGKVSAVYVNTDDAEIRDAATSAGAVPLEGMDYGGDSNAMLRHSAEQVNEDLILWAHPTNPLVTTTTYARAIDAFAAERAKPHVWRPDSLASVHVVRRHAWMFGSPLNHDPHAAVHQLAAELKPVFFQDGAIFIRPRADMASRPRFVGNLPYFFEMPENQSADIDTRADYALARAIYEAGL
jgi:N-acylneuraminate cytidylyltransferase